MCAMPKAPKLPPVPKTPVPSTDGLVSKEATNRVRLSKGAEDNIKTGSLGDSGFGENVKKKAVKLGGTA